MHSRLFAVAALFASGALAAESWVKIESSTIHALRDLRVRQGTDESFKPPTTGGYGDSCADAFGPGHIECADSQICYNPDEGQICCDAGYPCPADSWCLGDGYCCPNGVTSEDCAKDLGIPVPTNTGGSSKPTKTAEPPKETGGDDDEDVVTVTTTICPCSTGPSAPYPTGPSSPTNPAPTGTGAPTNPPSTGTSTPPPYTGAASIKGVASGSLAVVLVGLVQNLL